MREIPEAVRIMCLLIATRIAVGLGQSNHGGALIPHKRTSGHNHFYLMYEVYMNRLIGTPLLALFTLLPLVLSSCSNPSSAPGNFGTTITASDYSAPAFFNTQSFGDTSSIPFPFCFPVQYLQEKLGLTDTQVMEIQNLQDSLRLALQNQLALLQASGKISADSVRSLRLEYETDLYTGVAAILTTAQLAELQALQPPIGPPSQFGRGPIPGWGRRGFRGPGDTANVQLTGEQRDSVELARLETILAAAGDTLSISQITLIQNLQASLLADTTISPEGRRAEYDAQLQTILTADQIAALKATALIDRRRPHWH
jgi:hypothetical protein